MLLGILGPWQLLFMLILLVIPIIVLIVIFASRAKHKARAETLNTVIKESKSKSEAKYDQLEKLNKLRESGALTQEEYEKEKKKILG